MSTDLPPNDSYLPPIVEVEQNKDARLWATLCHLATFLGFTAIPFAHILGPLGVWLFKRNEYPFVDTHGKEALNFQISMTIYGLISTITICVGIGIVMLVAVVIIDVVFTVIAAIKANNGETYEYPLTIRLVK